MLNNEDMIEEYEPEIVTFFDDEGNEIEYELLDLVDYEGETYIVLIENDEEAQDVLILKRESVDEETEDYCYVDDEELLTKVFETFKEKYKDEFDFE